MTLPQIEAGQAGHVAHHNELHLRVGGQAPAIGAGPNFAARVNHALANYGAAVIAPNPTGWFHVDEPIEVGMGEALIGYGRGTSRLRAVSGLGSNPMIRYRAGNVGDITISGLALHGDNIASHGVYVYQTAQPAALAIPDAMNFVKELSVERCTEDGIYIGGSNAYSGNARETRVMGCLVQDCGGWGIQAASSDMFLENNTTHSNGSGGYLGTSNVSGNLKMVNCKAYYEHTIGISIQGSRANIVGGEVQDCAVGLRLGADSFASMTICTCGTNTAAALQINGGGSTLAIHMTSRNAPSGSPGTMQHAVNLTGNQQILGGFVNTNVATGKYANMYQGGNRPAEGSTIQIY